MPTVNCSSAFPEPGDIIFVKHGKASIAGKGIRGFQKIKSLSESNWGHVAVVVSHNEIIEAQFRKNAEVRELAPWKVARSSDETYLVLRHPNLSSAEKSPLVQAAAVYWHGEAYAVKELFRGEPVGPGRSICSSLALKILERSKLISNNQSQRSAQILPGELADLLFDNGWSEVVATDDYFNGFDQFLPGTVYTKLLFEEQNRKITNAMVRLGNLTAGVTGFIKFTTRSNYSSALRNLAVGSGVSTQGFLLTCFDSVLSEISYLEDIDSKSSSNWKYRNEKLSLRENCVHNLKAAMDIYEDVLQYCVSQFESIEAKIDSSRLNFSSLRSFTSGCDDGEASAEYENNVNYTEEASCQQAVKALLEIYLEISIIIHVFAYSHGSVVSSGRDNITSRRTHVSAIKNENLRDFLNNGLNVQEQLNSRLDVYVDYRNHVREFIKEIEMGGLIKDLDEYVVHLVDEWQG